MKTFNKWKNDMYKNHIGLSSMLTSPKIAQDDVCKFDIRILACHEKWVIPAFVSPKKFSLHVLFLNTYL